MTRGVRFSFLVALAGCWSGAATTPTKPAATDVSVALAAVTLADDCAPAQDVAAGACAEGYDCHMPVPMCEQSSMQLSLRAGDNAAATTVRVKRVELLDARGHVLAKLASRTPTRWTDSGYVAWDQIVAPNQTLAASYTLGAPDWDKLVGGRWNANGQTFQLRVTLAVGDEDRIVEKQSITPAMLEPPVVT